MFNKRFDSVIAHEDQALIDLKEYFGHYTGARFHSLGVNTRNRITCDDLCAVNLLGLRFNSRMIYDLTDEPFDSASSKLLAEIPDDVDIWQTGDFQAANELGEILEEITDVGPVFAGKILARKRPRLIPIYDDMVNGLLQAPGGTYRASFREALQDNDRVERLKELRLKAQLGEEVSLLRVFDVVAWMTAMRLKKSSSFTASPPHFQQDRLGQWRQRR